MTSPTMSAAPRLEVSGLSTSFATDAGRIQSVADVSFAIHPGETLALVGESGSGKSVTSLTLMGLHARTSQAQVTGQAWFVQRDGRKVDVLAMPEAEKRTLRGNELAMIFQEPMTSLNPVLTVGEQIAESARLHLKMDRSAALAHARRMLELVEIPAAAQRVHEYPHQLSGGMRQRVMIALAMACNPTLLIADEPTTALDVTLQAQILSEVQALVRERGTALIWISHDLSVVAGLADQIAVMYAGRIVEHGTVDDVLDHPQHPYTQGLIGSLPSANRRGTRLRQINGMAPSLLDMPAGCAFAPRCPRASGLCQQARPEISQPRPEASAHAVRCHHPGPSTQTAPSDKADA